MRAGVASKRMQAVLNELHPDTPEKVRPGDIVAAQWYPDETWYIGDAEDVEGDGRMGLETENWNRSGMPGVGLFEDAYSMVILARERR